MDSSGSRLTALRANACFGIHPVTPKDSGQAIRIPAALKAVPRYDALLMIALLIQLWMVLAKLDLRVRHRPPHWIQPLDCNFPSACREPQTHPCADSYTGKGAHGSQNQLGPIPLYIIQLAGHFCERGTGYLAPRNVHF